jgi:uncharacterized membrane protein (DUF2068 family)
MGMTATELLEASAAAPVHPHEASTSIRALGGGRREPALKLIIAYKLARAALSLLGALTVLVLVLTGLAVPLQRHLEKVHDHAVNAITLSLTRLLVSAAGSEHMLVLAAALALDGGMLLVEGWALLREWRWGVWLVVGASSLLVPFEVAAFLRHPAVERAVVVLINAAIVAWLVTHALRDRRRRRSSERSLPHGPW